MVGAQFFLLCISILVAWCDDMENNARSQACLNNSILSIYTGMNSNWSVMVMSIFSPDRIICVTHATLMRSPNAMQISFAVNKSSKVSHIPADECPRSTIIRRLVSSGSMREDAQTSA